LHGLSSNHTTWDAMVKKLQKAEINTLIWDQRGHGNSDMTRKASLYTFPVFAEDLYQILQAESIEKASFVGYSYGGPILFELAKSHPEMVEHLVLISANCISPPYYMGVGFVTPVLYAFYTLLGWLLLWQSRKKYYYYKHGDASGYIQSTLRGYTTMPLSVNFWMLAQMFRLDYRSLLPRLTMPVLIIRAEHDPFFSATEARYMARSLPNARITSPKHPSHFVASHAQDEIADMVISFI